MLPRQMGVQHSCPTNSLFKSEKNPRCSWKLWFKNSIRSLVLSITYYKIFWSVTIFHNYSHKVEIDSHKNIKN
jgi:hypothetical protein